MVDCDASTVVALLSVDFSTIVELVAIAFEALVVLTVNCHLTQTQAELFV